MPTKMLREKPNRHPFASGYTQRIPAIALLLAIVTYGSVAQEKKQPLVCKRAALAALKPLPKLTYRCGNAANDYDEKILKLPQRKIAINALSRRLETFTYVDWWESDIVDLNVCDLRRKPGTLTDDENQRFTGGDYPINLLGNDRIRLVLVADPCYQTGYGGTNGFLLFREAGRVFVTEVLDGFYSRADNPMQLDFATQNAEQIIEVSTFTGGLNPEVTNYYFVIDQKTKRTLPKNLFQGDKRLTNQITSAMLMSEPEALELPPVAGQLNIIRGHKLAPEFSIYADDSEGKIDDNGRKLTRTVLHWNGRFYK